MCCGWLEYYHEQFDHKYLGIIQLLCHQCVLFPSITHTEKLHLHVIGEKTAADSLHHGQRGFGSWHGTVLNVPEHTDRSRHTLNIG